MVVSFVTIKMNSTRLPGKNILPLGGHPLVERICDTLLACRRVDRIYIYCSDEHIMDYVPRSQRLEFLQRPKWLDGDMVTMHDVYGSFISEVDADIYVAALATAPFITAETIDRGIEAITDFGYDSSLSVKRLQTYVWYDGHPVNFYPDNVLRTQDLKPAFIETCGFYAFRREVWQQNQSRVGTNPFFVEVLHQEAIDIDNRDDYDFARVIAETEQKR